MVKPWVPHRFPAQSHDGPEDTHLCQGLMIHFLHMPRLRFIFCHFDCRKAMLQSHFPVSRSNIQIKPFWLFILFFVPILHGFWAGKPRNSLQVVRCSYVVPNKGRRCRFPVLPGTSFCGAHREDESVERVPCPLDPNHTVFKSPGARWGISFPWFWD